MRGFFSKSVVVWGLVLGSAAAAATAAPPPPPKIPAESFGELPFIRNPQISPDGHYVLAES